MQQVVANYFVTTSSIKFVVGALRIYFWLLSKPDKYASFYTPLIPSLSINHPLLLPEKNSIYDIHIYKFTLQITVANFSVYWLTRTTQPFTHSPIDWLTDRVCSRLEQCRRSISHLTICSLPNGQLLTSQREFLLIR